MSDATLRALAWDHPRGIGAAAAATRAWSKARPDVDVIWDARPLWKFAYMPLRVMFGEYDVVLIDHPTVGTLVDGAPPMQDMTTLIGPQQLSSISRDTVGPCYASYATSGGQWALPIDAAVQVSVMTLDLAAERAHPETWDEMLDLAEKEHAAGRGIALPMNYSDAAVNLCTLGYQVAGASFYSVTSGFRRDALERALEALDALRAFADASTLGLPPVRLLEEMAEGKGLRFAPLHFGYVNYTDRHYPVPLRFGDAARFNADAEAASSLGGVGIAVSRWSGNAELAAQFAAFLASPEVQTSWYASGGGQPSSKSAWGSPELDARSGGFYSTTRRTMDAAVIRPRRADAPWFFAQQVKVGHLLADRAERGLTLSGLTDQIIEIDEDMRAASSAKTGYEEHDEA